MKNIINRFLLTVRNNFIVHPILFAIFPVLFLYTENIKITTFNHTFFSMIISVFGTILLWLLLSLLMKNFAKAALATTIIVLAFYLYGRFYDLGLLKIKHRYFIPIVLFVLGSLVFFIKKAKWNFKNLTKIFNFIAVVLILINLANIGLYQINKSGSSTNESIQASDNGAVASTVSQDTPDIYYLIFDEYAHPDTMKEYYNYDNSEFIERMQKRGFYWAAKSQTTAWQSFQSITMSLNMEYLDINADKSVYIPKLDNSQVAGFLKQQGYRFIYINTDHDAFVGYKINSDVTYNLYHSTSGSIFLGDFSRTLWRTTMLAPVYDFLIKDPFYEYNRMGVIKSIEKLKNLNDTSTPKFVFAHILSPHEPFVFGSEGTYISSDNWFNYEDRSFYLGQYIFITKQIEQIVDSIFNNSKKQPIIIIQSDHGLRTREGTTVGDDDWKNILNLYYLPEGGDKMVYPEIAPVNSFRVVFNYYFGANYELLKEK